jgi:hypothetical protein
VDIENRVIKITGKSRKVMENSLNLSRFLMVFVGKNHEKSVHVGELPAMFD